MNWLEVSIEAHGDPEGTCEVLSELGAGPFVIEDEADFKDFLENNTQYWDFVDEQLVKDLQGASRVKFWTTDDEAGLALVALLQEKGLAPTVKHVQDSDWENNWRDHYEPVEAGDHLVIVPEWQSYDGDRIPVKLDPGLLFGTGDHPTTRMCLTAVERYAGSGKRVLDIGCGSGILGIAAAVLGSEEIIAADVDDKAPDVVRSNAALNGVEERFSVYVGDVISDGRLRKKLGTDHDLVLANIVADVIIPLAPFVPGLMSPTGVFVCSGIIDGREDEVGSALAAAGMTVLEHDHMDDWHCFVCRKEEQ